MTALFRLYDEDELGADGYPPEWHRITSDDLGIGVLTERRFGIKDLVREQAGHRCVRCDHPYVCGDHGTGEWSPCDEQCAHGPLIRYRWDSRLPWNVEEHVAEGWRRALAGAEIEARWRILTVHHLDGNKANCRWWNLAALCQRCHLTIQGKVQMARVWPWEHSDWFRPYVAGYYAHTYLGEDLTRAEVDARLEELLGLERVA